MSTSTVSLLESVPPDHPVARRTRTEEEAPDASQPVAGRPAPPAARKGPPKALLVVFAVAAIGGTGWYLHARNFEDTDDAQVDGDIGTISPRIAGTLTKVNVSENDVVKAGDVLAEIDPADYAVVVAQSEAAVAQAQALLQAEDPSVPIASTSNEAAIRSASLELAASGAALSQARKEQSQLTATLAQAKANDKLAQIELERSTKLLAANAVPKADFDTRESAATAADAVVRAQADALAASQDRIEQARSRMESAQTRLNEARTNAPRTVETRRASVVARQAALELAQQQLAQAKLNLSYTKLIAPANGIIGRKSVTVGDRVAPGQQLMALSETDSLWITANFRETQLRRMHPHQPVAVYVDAIDAELHGEVENIGGATGSRYSVLPPENATGNYVKVVQRIPVRIRLDPGQAGLERLRPGMSVEPKVRVSP
jgi:membrane fusion protein (multidrug efflux system)